jgi:hypothetical protein
LNKKEEKLQVERKRRKNCKLSKKRRKICKLNEKIGKIATQIKKEKTRTRDENPKILCEKVWGKSSLSASALLFSIMKWKATDAELGIIN